MEGANDKVFCVKCEALYHGKVQSNSDFNGGYIEECTQNNECNFRVRYLNLHPIYTNTISCSICSNNKIPFVGLEVDMNTYDIIGLKPYGL